MAAPDRGSAVDGIDPPESGVDWWSILETLDARRLRALTERDPSALAGYLVPGSPAWDADSGIIAELRGLGLKPIGLATHIIAIERVEMAPAMQRATVVLVDQRSAYTLVDAQGAVVHSVDSPGSRRWEVELIRVVGSPSEEPQSDAPPSEAPPSDAGPQADGESLSGGPASTDPSLDAQGGDAGWRMAEVTPIP